MKKTKLLNSGLSGVISQMGHTQYLTIGDAGLPVPKGIQRIDLAVSQGIPTFLEVLDAVMSELCVEKIVLAEEIREKSPKMHEQILQRFPGISVEYISHESFKARMKDSAAIVRTGETTAYSNIMLVSGVTF